MAVRFFVAEFMLSYYIYMASVAPVKKPWKSGRRDRDKHGRHS